MLGCPTKQRPPQGGLQTELFYLTEKALLVTEH